MDFSNHKFRCFSLGHIMQDPKEKSNKEKYAETLSLWNKVTYEYTLSNKATKAAAKLFDRMNSFSKKLYDLEPFLDEPNLSEGCKTHLADVFTSVKYNRREDIKNKYTEKGLLLEEDLITEYSLLTSRFHKKNKERKTNDFITGELDFVEDDMIFDAKVNWSIFQFTRTASKPIKHLYKWQLDGYMWLFDKPKARLVYGLLNTPEHLIVIEEKKLLYDFVGSKEDYEEACKELRRNHIYDDIPAEEKIRIYDVERSEEREEQIRNRVIDCRKYLNSLNNFNNFNKEEDEVDN